VILVFSLNERLLIVRLFQFHVEAGHLGETLVNIFDGEVCGGFLVEIDGVSALAHEEHLGDR